jgi:hypothetical protein
MYALQVYDDAGVQHQIIYLYREREIGSLSLPLLIL